LKLYLSEIEADRPRFLGGGVWQIEGLAPITVIFGRNGSGKSLLLRSLRDQDQDQHHYVSPERAGNISFSASLIEIEGQGHERANRSKQNFDADFRSRVVTRIQSLLLIRGAREHLQGVASRKEIEALASSFLPDFSLEIIPRTPGYVLTRLTSGEKVDNVNVMSSGETESLALALDVLTMCAIWELEDRDRRILLIDEPDTHFHPDLQHRFAEFLVRVTKRFDAQVLVATHSTTMLAALSHFGSGETAVLYLNRQDFQTARRTTDVEREIATLLGGHALMGPLFGSPLLLVEGDDDFRIWSQASRHNVVAMAVIPCGGQRISQYQQTLETILGSILDSDASPSGFALVDGDKSLPEPNEHRPQDRICFLQLNCHESENLYLSDEVLADMGIDWSEACARVQARAADFGDKQGQLAAIDTWYRRKADIKKVIRELSVCLDDKSVHWTDRVGRVIGRQRPTGMLADFLGEGVLSAFWSDSN
jgi:predicted ATPase